MLYSQIIILSSDNKINRIAKRVSNALGITPICFNDPDNLLVNGSSINNFPSMVLVDSLYHNFLGKIDKLLSNLCKEVHYISIGSDFSTSLIEFDSEKKILNNNFGQCYISRQAYAFEEKLMCLLNFIQNSTNIDDKYYNYISTSHNYIIKQTFDIKSCIQQFDKYTNSLGFSKITESRLSVIAYEIICNAVYNSPQLAGKSYEEVRKNDTKLGDGNHVNFSYVYDGRKFSICCIDNNGTLTYDKIHENLKRSITKGVVRDSENWKYGAGLGFYMLWCSLDELMISVENGKRTVFIGNLYPLELYKIRKKKSEVQFFTFIKK